MGAKSVWLPRFQSLRNVFRTPQPGVTFYNGFRIETHSRPQGVMIDPQLSWFWMTFIKRPGDLLEPCTDLLLPSLRNYLHLPHNYNPSHPRVLYFHTTPTYCLTSQANMATTIAQHPPASKFQSHCRSEID